MDIEKLKAEFEQSECFKKLEHVAQYTFFEFGAYLKRTDVPDNVEKKCGHLITALIFSWGAWKEAKAQSDKKIKLLLCDEHLQKCESPTGIFNSQYPDEEPCLICLAKEAKAQAVPEGFVLVPREPTEEMIQAGRDERRDLGTVASTYKAMIEAQELAND
ncbi:hypothetical protein MOW14_05635 [Acinetobacter indicus]|uniref:hypothetical protein n=1 Tax=Acinetobacter indicus TaxID=756892 RepID=UPI001FA74622|nr:hypothetical protein [Acinetobacter indicus]UNW10640.1 hypothetical protein MOW14_05635 [Acinetobacter indicus]